MIGTVDIRANLQAVQERMAAAAQRAGRDPEEVRLVVVTKGHPAEVFNGLLEAGLHTFGENYVEEAIEKIEALGQTAGVEWHMIGHVQSRKAAQVVAYFDTLHSLDSLKLARRLSGQAVEQERRLPCLLECNVSGEASKYGLAAAEKQDWPALFSTVEAIRALPSLDLRGLMCMAPIVDRPETARPIFAKARRLRDALREQFGPGGWDQLSMGMSADFEAAILEGATMVRIGTAVLGPRPPRKPKGN